MMGMSDGKTSDSFKVNVQDNEIKISKKEIRVRLSPFDNLDILESFEAVENIATIIAPVAKISEVFYFCSEFQTPRQPKR